MVQDVRSSTTGNVVFDLLSQQGVMKALAFVRNSTASAAEKRELRDLIFSYTNTGGDPALRTLIEQRLQLLDAVDQTQAGINSVTEPAAQPVVVEAQTTIISSTEVATAAAPLSFVPHLSAEVPVPTSESTPKTASLSFGRRAPTFARPAVVAAVIAPVSVADPVVVPPIPEIEPVVIKAPEFVSVPPAIEAMPVVPNIPEVTAPVEVVTPVVVLASMPAVPTPVVVPTIPAVTSEIVAPVSEVVQTVLSSAPYSETAETDVYRARIAAIKQEVNAKVGNPVNLINLNREVGNTYMSALLTAMKAVSGAAGDPIRSMRELEDAYKNVLQLFAPTSEAPQNAQSSVVPAVEPATSTPIVPISPLSIDRRQLGGVPAQTVATETLRPVDTTVDDNPTPVVPVAEPEVRVAATATGISSVAAAVPLKKPTDLPSAADKKAALGITDPLLDPDVDAGLDQLLSEWVLFKKSGMFGTGPKGKEHPLFLKLAPINMVLIVSGRFEGATTEIRQSITDYMNGWRYEQGITYESSENFEHYLRRVVRHILDLQSNRRTS